jgi:hypothetical protein
MMILTNRISNECIECSFAHASTLIHYTPKTISVWSKQFKHKEVGSWNLYFDKKLVKQNKGKNLLFTSKKQEAFK